MGRVWGPLNCFLCSSSHCGHIEYVSFFCCSLSRVCLSGLWRTEISPAQLRQPGPKLWPEQYCNKERAAQKSMTGAEQAFHTVCFPSTGKWQRGKSSKKLTLGKSKVSSSLVNQSKGHFLSTRPGAVTSFHLKVCSKSCL